MTGAAQLCDSSQGALFPSDTLGDRTSHRAPPDPAHHADALTCGGISEIPKCIAKGAEIPVGGAFAPEGGPRGREDRKAKGTASSHPRRPASHSDTPLRETRPA